MSACSILTTRLANACDEVDGDCLKCDLFDECEGLTLEQECSTCALLAVACDGHRDNAACTAWLANDEEAIQCAE